MATVHNIVVCFLLVLVGTALNLDVYYTDRIARLKGVHTPVGRRNVMMLFISSAILTLCAMVWFVKL